MVKGITGGQNLPPDVNQVIDQLERHCLAPDGSLVSKSAYLDLQLVLSLSIYLYIFVYVYAYIYVYVYVIC